jgi:hypothetical protein
MTRLDVVAVVVVEGRVVNDFFRVLPSAAAADLSNLSTLIRKLLVDHESQASALSSNLCMIVYEIMLVVLKKCENNNNQILFLAM